MCCDDDVMLLLSMLINLCLAHNVILNSSSTLDARENDAEEFMCSSNMNTESDCVLNYSRVSLSVCEVVYRLVLIVVIHSSEE